MVWLTIKKKTLTFALERCSFE